MHQPLPPTLPPYPDPNCSLPPLPLPPYPPTPTPLPPTPLPYPLPGFRAPAGDQGRVFRVYKDVKSIFLL